MKGIILAAGSGTRLFPVTKVNNKHFLTIYNKPMIYYPLSILMLLKIKDIAIICNPSDEEKYFNLLGNGNNYGVKFTYITQDKPKGLADAYNLTKDFLKKQRSIMILGDNFFYGATLIREIKKIINTNTNTIFSCEVKDPSKYGIIKFKENKIFQIIEKPLKNISNQAVTGLYILDRNAQKYIKKIKPSKRGELEITSLLNIYIKKNRLNLFHLRRGTAWLDMGTFKDIHEASNFVKILEERQGKMVACLEEIALNNNWIKLENINKIIKSYKKNEYSNYIKKLINYNKFNK